jgi:PrtD family type I secretion system ABC transporter
VALNSGRFLTAILVFSLALNLLTLASPIFMMQVYDRVMVSHSVPTLVALLVIIGALQATQSLIHYCRALALRRYAAHIDETLEEVAFEETVAPVARDKTWRGEDTPLQHLSNQRTYIVGNGLAALFDVPWVIIFAIIMFLLHPWLGMLALAFTVSIGLLSIAAHLASANAPGINDKAALYRDPFRDAIKAQTIRGYGLFGRFKDEWLNARIDGRNAKAESQTWADVFRTMGRGLKTIQGSVILALAAYLTLENMATFGVMMASSIIAGRMSAPVDGLITSWKDIRAAWRSRPYLRALAKLDDGDSRKRDLPPPVRSVELANVSVGPADNRMLSSISLKLSPGDTLGVIGPTGAGKSTLISLMAGAIAPRNGKIKFDDVERRYWRETTLGASIGYIPQEVVFFDGTIAENIARFEAELDDDEVIEAARAIGIHEIIDHMPEGYDTKIINSGRNYPASFRVKLGLARAFYRKPFLLLLDNPTGNFDHDGEMHLAEYLRGHKERGGVLVMATSHMSALMLVDKVVALSSGMAGSVGPREDLFKPIAAEQMPQRLAVIPGNQHVAGQT